MPSEQETDRVPQCEYMATADENGVRDAPGEVVEGNVVHCTADADVVLRPPGALGLRYANDPGGLKKVVCRAHAQYLRREKTDKEKAKMNAPPRQWEQCGENSEVLRADHD